MTTKPNDSASLWVDPDDVLMIVLCGGDKTTQAQDIKTAKHIAADWRAEP